MTPIVVLLLGQSNANGVYPYGAPMSLADDHAGAVVIDNGETLSAYDERFGPEPFLVGALIGHGYQPTVVIRAANGAPLTPLRDKLLPAAVVDLGALGVAPDVVVFVHGEADSRIETQASTYAKRLVGPHDGDALLERIHKEWPGVPLVVTEMKHTSTNYGAFHERIRAEQVLAAEHPSVCLVPTADLKFRDKVHYSDVGLEGLGERIAQQIKDGCGPTVPPR